MLTRREAVHDQLHYNTTLGVSLNEMALYRHIHCHDSRLPPPDYARVSTEAFKAHSVIAASPASSSDDGPTSADMAGTSKEFAHQLEAYARLQAQRQEELSEQK